MFAFKKRFVALLCSGFTLCLSSNSADAEDIIEIAGDAIQVINPLVALSISYSKDDTQGIKYLAQTTAANFILTHGLKRALNKVEVQGKRLGERPNGSDYNFPSGHTSSAFAAAWYLHKRYNYEYKYSALPLVGAIFTGYSRIHSDNHDVKAVLAGAILGIASAELLTEPIQIEDTSVSFRTNFRKDFSFSFIGEF